MDAELIVRIEGPLGSISFQRPAARNALTLAMLEGMAAAFRDFADHPELRAVLIRGAGELPFSAGYNMDELPARMLTADDARAIHAPVRAVADAIRACPVTVIAAARRFVFGAALDLFTHCDLRVCADDTTFCMPPNRYGFLYPPEGMRRLAEVAGLAGAQDMLLTGQPVDAQRALAMGLVQRAYPVASFEQELAALGETVAANAPLSMRATKEMLQGDGSGSGADIYQRMADCLNSEDAREAQLAFRARRPPVFCGH